MMGESLYTKVAPDRVVRCLPSSEEGGKICTCVLVRELGEVGVGLGLAVVGVGWGWLGFSITGGRRVTVEG